jgi:hypothetical protein
LLRRPTERAGVGGGRNGLRGTQAHHLQARTSEARQEPGETSRAKTGPRTILTSGPVGSISRSHGDRSWRSIQVSTAFRARVSAYPCSRGSGVSATSPARWGPPPPSSRRCRAASPSEARSAGGGGRRGRLPRSARASPGSSGRPGASPAASDAGPWTPRSPRSWASPGAPDQCRGEAGLGVAKVEPPPLPAGVVGRHGTRDVVVLVLRPQGERHAVGAHRAAGPLLRRRLREQLRAEEVY